jgi:ferredoxin
LKAKVDQETCIGCAMCENTCPEVFKLADGKSTVIQDPVAKENEADAQAAADNCPVSAITVE